MGEYAHDLIRKETKKRYGIDIGVYDEDAPKQSKPVYKRVACPYCKATPKERGLQQHIQDVHSAAGAR